MRDPVGIGQAAHVEYQIGVLGNTVLETEGFHQHCHGVGGFAHAHLDQVAQLVQRQGAGVDDQAGAGRHRVQHVPFALDGFAQGFGIAADGVLAAGFAETLDQGLIVGIQVDHLAVDTVTDQFAQNVGQFLQLTAGVAGVDADGGHGDRGIGMRQLLHQVLQQGDRKIVDAVVADIFQHMQRRGFAGAGAAADHHQLHGRVVSLQRVTAASPMRHRSPAVTVRGGWSRGGGRRSAAWRSWPGC